MKNVMFSIIIPLYNKENYICNTIHSVLQQGYGNFELIIVDDGSTDNSAEKVSCIKDDRIRYFYKANGGVSSARNYGIHKAKSDFIIFLDADDIWNIDFLETMYKLINMFPQCGIYGVAYSRISLEKENMISYKENDDSFFIVSDYCLASYKMKAPICCSDSVCIKKAAFEAVGVFKEGIKHGEDLDMWIRIISSFSFGYCNQKKVSYILESENNAVCNSRTSYKDYICFWDWFNLDYVPQKSLYLYTTYCILKELRTFCNMHKYKDVISIFKGFAVLSIQQKKAFGLSCIRLAKDLVGKIKF